MSAKKAAAKPAKKTAKKAASKKASSSTAKKTSSSKSSSKAPVDLATSGRAMADQEVEPRTLHEGHALHSVPSSVLNPAFYPDPE